MKEQKELLQRFMKLFNQPTLQEISNQTGIQITRVFRIMNFAPMKFSEYLIFKNLIDLKICPDNSLAMALDQSLNELSIDTIDDIKQQIERKLQLKKLLTKDDSKEAVYA
ncbi:MAG: hypothetical protein A2381_00795 [Bdellovibrionales bacterium RIFOXYB1_FULL_37_110]|nr:MAG: hypothetical protein A2417_01650 [Bdellovibrionales bacterium RIFOXYC1_FULL_37_79]OFZ52955.1 MAG: hypothetical protein A2328_02835 [Bdellovibrionales bacterium RIFOXYB2_FULL_36_6]OFZ58757.1 MAG: hypothetical protein A2381_00795 [Bdellovibrionales bacterium RIFOXYB1_FULL_37_110]OFZ64756.1 MAG: hypothetical protein A2577_06795 [Bdellovibrionales bacterium RIFOXYD1_FULL_36_51]